MRQLRQLRRAILLADGAGAFALFAGTSFIRFGGGWRDVWNAAGMPWWAWAASFAAIWMTAEWLLELDLPRTRWSTRAELQDVVRASALVAVSVFSLLFLLHLPQISRQFILLLLALESGTALIERALLRQVLELLRRRGVGRRNVLVIGTGDRAQQLADLLEGHRELGFRVIGHLGPAAGAAVTRPVLGTLLDLEHVMHSRVVDELGVCPDGDDAPYVEALVTLAQQEGKLLRIPVDAATAQASRGRVEMIDGQRVLTITNSPDRLLAFAFKRVIDTLVAGVALVTLSPLFLLIAVLVRSDGGGSVLFRQTRVGLHGRRFTMLKFRSMVPGAEGMLGDLAEQNTIHGHAFKVDRDPRITKAGEVLRRTSLDELPQLWNVLLGQMSIVGPRPPLPCEVDGYDLWHRRRLSMKPGITGLWQVSARLEAEFDRWVELDLSYIDRWSLWLDLKIMLRTVPAMLSGR